MRKTDHSFFCWSDLFSDDCLVLPTAMHSYVMLTTQGALPAISFSHASATSSVSHSTDIARPELASFASPHLHSRKKRELARQKTRIGAITLRVRDPCILSRQPPWAFSIYRRMFVGGRTCTYDHVDEEASVNTGRVIPFDDNESIIRSRRICHACASLSRELSMYDMSNLNRLQKLEEHESAGVAAFWAFDKAAFEEGALPVQIKQLIAVAVALTTQCLYCIELHTAAARDAGATNAQLAETAVVAAAIRAGGAITHATHLMQD